MKTKKSYSSKSQFNNTNPYVFVLDGKIYGQFATRKAAELYAEKTIGYRGNVMTLSQYEKSLTK